MMEEPGGRKRRIPPYRPQTRLTGGRLREVKTTAKPIEGTTAAPGDDVARFDWIEVADDLNSHGAAILEALLTPQRCQEIASLYSVFGPAPPYASAAAIRTGRL